VNRMARLPRRNIMKYAKWGSITSWGSYGGNNSMGLHSVSSV
jgi:hypothetical protein